MATVTELKKQAKELKVKGWWLMTKAELQACVNVFSEELRIKNAEQVTKIVLSPGEVFPGDSIPLNSQTVKQLDTSIPLDTPGLLINNRVPPQGKHESVEEYLSRGGKITELPAPSFPAPKPTRESSAMKKNPVPEKKAPRRKVDSKRKLDAEIHAEITAEVNATSRKEKRVPHKVKTETKVSGRRATDTGVNVVTLASMVESAGIEARIARRRLRNSDIEKPGAQWEWPAGHKDIAKVKELLK